MSSIPLRIAAFGAAAAILLSGCAQTNDAANDAAVSVETQSAQTGTLSTSSAFLGTVSAEGTANVVAQLSGAVKSIAVSVGDRVDAGTALAALDDTAAQFNLQNAQAGLQNAQASVASAQASFASAQTSLKSAQQGVDKASINSTAQADADRSALEDTLKKAEENYKANLELLEIGAVSQSEVDDAYSQVLSAQAAIQAAQSGISSAETGVESAQAGLVAADHCRRCVLRPVLPAWDAA